MPPTSPHHDPWERHEGFDLWSIPHLLFGVLMGATPSLLGIGIVTALALTAGLAVAWEIGERIYGVRESAKNIDIDIILSVVGVSAVSFLLAAFPLERGVLIAIVALILAAYAAISFSGWKAYRRRNSR